MIRDENHIARLMNSWISNHAADLQPLNDLKTGKWCQHFPATLEVLDGMQEVDSDALLVELGVPANMIPSTLAEKKCKVKGGIGVRSSGAR